MNKILKIISKSSIFLGIPAGVAGLTLGISVGIKNNFNANPLLPPKNDAERYFDDVLTKSSYQLSNDILFPSGGINLFTKENLIPLYEKYSSKESMRKMIKATGSKLDPVKTLSIDFSKLKNFIDVPKEFLKTNKDISDFLDQNKSKKYGIYWTYFAADRRAIFELYELKNDPADKAIVDYYFKYIDDMTNKNPKWSFSPGRDFVTTVITPRRFRNISLHQQYGVDGAKIYWPKSVLNNPKPDLNQKFQFVNFTRQDERISINQFDKTDDFSMNLKSNYKYVDLDAYLIKRKFFVLQKPIIEYQKDSTNKSYIKIIFNFYKVNDESIIDVASKFERVSNPVNVYKKVLSIPIKPFLDIVKDHTIDNQPIDPNGTSIKIEDKELKTNKQTKNSDIFYERLTNNWIKYLELPLVIPGLNLMGAMLPSVYSYTHNFVQTIKVLRSLKTKTNISYKGKSKNALEWIFKEKIGTTNKNLIENIFDSINNSDYIQPTLLWNTLFKDFKGDKDSKWANLDMFTSSGTSIVSDGQPSSGRLLYLFISGMYTMDNPIRKRIEFLSKEGLFKNPYNDFNNDKILEQLLFLLKDKKIISKNISINDVIDKPFVFFGSVLDSLWDEKSFPLDERHFKLVLSILGKDTESKLSQDFTKKLGDFFKDEENLKELAELVKSPIFSTGESFINKIKSDPYYIISLIGQNASDHQDFLEKLGRMVFDKKVLGEAISLFTGSSTDFSAIFSKLKSGFKSQKDFDEILSALIGKDAGTYLPAIKWLLLDNLFQKDYKAVADALGSPTKVSDVQNLYNIIAKGFRHMSPSEIGASINSIKTILTSSNLTTILNAVPNAGGAITSVSGILDKLTPLGDSSRLASIIYYLTR